MINAFALFRNLTKTLVAAAVLFVFLAGPRSLAQNEDPPAPALAGAQRNREEDAWETQQRRELAKKENVQRQQDLKKDTDKLLELATELKQYVDKTNENMLSIDVIKKAEQIEKLAHSVKDKMKRD